MDCLVTAQISSSPDERRELTRRWIDRMRVDEANGNRELANERLRLVGPVLIAEVFEAIGDRGASRGRIAERGRDRLLAAFNGEASPERARDGLAALVRVLIEAIDGAIGGRRDEFAVLATGLTEVFAEIRAGLDAAPALAEDTAGWLDPLTRLPGPAAFDRLLRMLTDGYERYGQPFSLAVLDVDELDRIVSAYGPEAGERAVGAVATVLTGQIRASDLAFRRDGGGLAVVAPHTPAPGLAVMARRAARVIESAQAAEGPRIAFRAGIAGCPDDGSAAEHLIARAEEAAWAARAEGRPVAIAALE